MISVLENYTRRNAPIIFTVIICLPVANPVYLKSFFRFSLKRLENKLKKYRNNIKTRFRGSRRLTKGKLFIMFQPTKLLSTLGIFTNFVYIIKNKNSEIIYRFFIVGTHDIKVVLFWVLHWILWRFQWFIRPKNIFSIQKKIRNTKYRSRRYLHFLLAKWWAKFEKTLSATRTINTVRYYFSVFVINK